VISPTLFGALILVGLKLGIDQIKKLESISASKAIKIDNKVEPKKINIFMRQPFTESGLKERNIISSVVSQIESATKNRSGERPNRI